MRDSTHTPIDKWDPTSVGGALGTDEAPVLEGVARSAYGHDSEIGASSFEG
jgi:hypothetical protein